MTEFKKHTERPSDLQDAHLAAKLRELSDSENKEFLEAAADRIDRFNRLSKILGLLAPGGTAPRTALEQIYIQSGDTEVTETPIVLDLRLMLEQHWGEWTPALREAEGLPPTDPEQI